MLAIYMDRAQCYDDYHFLQERAGQVALKLLYPRQSLTFTQEDMPDLTAHLIAVDFWEKNPEIQRFKHPADIAIVRMFTKAQPKPCVPREFAETMKTFWADPDVSDYLFDFWRRTMAAGLLGTYDHCKTVANFTVRYSAYAWLFFDKPSRKHSISWIEANGKLHMYTIRELLFWTSRQVNAFDQFMTDRYFWRRMRANAYEAMDACRQIFNQHALSPHFKGAHEACKGILNQYNTQNLMYSSRLSTNSITRKAVSECAIADAWARDCKPPLPAFTPPTPREKEIIKKVIFQYHKSDESGGRELGIDWLAPMFEVSYSKTIQPIQNAIALERAEVKQTALALSLKDIRVNKPREFGLLKYFFEAIQKEDSLASVRLPWVIASRQIEALRRKHYGCLPPSSGLYFLCPSCGFFKSDIRLSKKRHNQTAHKMYYNLGNGKNYCSVIIPRGSKAILRRGPSPKKSRKAKTEVRKEKSEETKRECVTTEVLAINMIGKMVTTPVHGEVLLCSDCGRLMEYSIDAFRDGLPSCGCMNIALNPPPKKRGRRGQPAILDVEEERKYLPTLKCIDCLSSNNTNAKTLHLAFTPEGKIVYSAFCVEHLSWRTEEKKFFLNEKKSVKEEWPSLHRGRDGYYFK
jgi:hypothetical protein